MITFDKDSLPGGFREYRKLTVTSMAEIGPLTQEVKVVTSEGDYVLPVGWEGYVALDADEIPYPVEKSIADRTYEVV
jgi:hypothetical protein